MSSIGPVTGAAAQLLGVTTGNLNQSADRSVERAKIQAQTDMAKAQLDAEQRMTDAKIQSEEKQSADTQAGFDKQRTAQMEMQSKEIASQQQVAQYTAEQNAEMQQDRQKFDAEEAAKATSLQLKLRQLDVAARRAKLQGSRDTYLQKTAERNQVEQELAQTTAQMAEADAAIQSINSLTGESVSNIKQDVGDLGEAISREDQHLTTQMQDAFDKGLMDFQLRHAGELGAPNMGVMGMLGRVALAVATGGESNYGGQIVDAVKETWSGTPNQGQLSGQATEKLISSMTDAMSQQGIFDRFKGNAQDVKGALAAYLSKATQVAVADHAANAATGADTHTEGLQAEADKALADLRTKMGDDTLLVSVVRKLAERADVMASDYQKSQAKAQTGEERNGKLSLTQRDRIIQGLRGLSTMDDTLAASGLRHGAAEQHKMAGEMVDNLLVAMEQTNPQRFQEILTEAHGKLGTPRFKKLLGDLDQARSRLIARSDKTRAKFEMTQKGVQLRARAQQLAGELTLPSDKEFQQLESEEAELLGLSGKQ